MGSAAAMQALKMFTGGSSGSSSGGSSQNAFIGMAMGQASKLFDSQASQGNVSEGASKESAIQKAGESKSSFPLSSVHRLKQCACRPELSTLRWT